MLFGEIIEVLSSKLFSNFTKIFCLIQYPCFSLDHEKTSNLLSNFHRTVIEIPTGVIQKKFYVKPGTSVKTILP